MKPFPTFLRYIDLVEGRASAIRLTALLIGAGIAIPFSIVIIVIGMVAQGATGWYMGGVALLVAALLVNILGYAWLFSRVAYKALPSAVPARTIIAAVVALLLLAAPLLLFVKQRDANMARWQAQAKPGVQKPPTNEVLLNMLRSRFDETPIESQEIADYYPMSANYAQARAMRSLQSRGFVTIQKDYPDQYGRLCFHVAVTPKYAASLIHNPEYRGAWFVLGKIDVERIEGTPTPLGYDEIKARGYCQQMPSICSAYRIRYVYRLAPTAVGQAVLEAKIPASDILLVSRAPVTRAFTPAAVSRPQAATVILTRVAAISQPWGLETGSPPWPDGPPL